MNTSQSSDQDSGRKPSPFDNLSRDDLVKKCKGLLGIAQKAKQAKDECQEENRRLKEQLGHFETQKNADKECIKAMQEVADSYMDQKLQATMKVDELEKQMTKLKAQLADEVSAHEQQTKTMRLEMDQLKEKLALLERDATTCSAEQFAELREENSNLEKERIALEQELIKLKGSQTVLGDSAHTPREEKLIRKLKLYKAKVQEINAKLLLLKSDRKILLKTVKEYSDQVPKWQKDLVNASNVLFEKIRLLELEKSNLEEKVGQHEELQKGLREKNDALERKVSELMREIENGSLTARDQTDDGNTDGESNETQVEELRAEIERLNSSLASMEVDKQSELAAQEAKLQTDSEEKESLRTDLEVCKQTIVELKAKILAQEEVLTESMESQRSLSTQVDQYKQQTSAFEQQEKQLQEELQKQTQQLEHHDKVQHTLEENVESLTSKLSEMQRENHRLQEALESMSTEGGEKLVALQKQLSETSQTLADMEREKEGLAKKIVSLEGELQAQASKMAEENQQVMQKLIVENQNLEAQLAQLAEKLKGSIGKFKQSQERCKRLEQETESRMLELEELLSEKTRLLDEAKQARADNDEKCQQLTVDLQTKSNSIVELEQEKERFAKELAELKTRLQQNDNKLVDKRQSQVQKLQEQITTLSESCDRLKTENGELLSELKEINEMLKDRGEVINLQLSKIAELQDKLSRAETVDMQPLKQQIEQLQSTVAEKEAELERQRDELATAINRSNVSFDAQSDVMSTSTISRVEDVARLREIDESFEEKYIKLRSLAVKLKKKVAEQTVLLQKYEKETSAAPNSATITSDSSVQAMNKNVQTLQSENDRLQDQLDGMTQEMAKLRSELEQKSIDLTTLEQVQKDVEGTSKDRSALETAIREYQTQIQNLKREKEAFQLAKKEIDAENQRLKSSLKAKEKEIAEGAEQQKELRSELERSKLAVKKANVLTLEMEAYERSLAELNTKLEAKKTLVKELEGTIDVQERTMKSLKQQLTILEEGLEAQQKHSRELKQEVDAQQGKLRQSEHQRIELSDQLEELRDEHDRLKQKVENNRVELEQIAADKEKTCGSLEVEKNSLLKRNVALEDELSELRKDLVGKQQELDDVRTEFASYKIRAQSVLRQNQNKDSSREKELEEEVSQLQRSLDAVEGKQQALAKQISDLSRSNDELKNERDRTQARCKELLALLEENRLHIDSLMEESRKQSSDHQEALKTQRIQNETLVQCYKKQLEEQQETHSRELQQLQQTLRSRPEATLDSLSSVAGRSTLLNNNNLQSLLLGPGGSGANRATFTDEQRINLLLMEREDGEGSESTGLGAAGGPVGTLRRKLSTSSRLGRSGRDVIPLDELLNTSFDDTASVAMTDGEHELQQHQGLLFGRDSSPTVELQHTKEQLSKQESRVRHLTAVLAEAEQDLAKLTQLNELLKEEVRRQQRSIEREAHVHNSEYLKNVIFKFVTLSNGDERSRLVPVLNTILKLSPEETQKLQNVAKGSDPSARGWTGLLWS
ncbi:GRIP and coiled-coil domain-containing protein 2-like isoform X1 [Anopheles merus]|uniref:GRIP and coiled-coil domain-containing protein 2-like isoform X1 n=1 Tax=Anopheles merus TaxID=30066 RepID=UPI001BE4568A|nr:GRIP and coiled-coil domain-containing protein 2-like isoform X1 [Anopheles merus]XP_041767355.1 GRIP and coiled-coil domain-containing protein 2-like isoform X1 [Anopheles merus]XP_041767356.1 GRIP and coiled-coil domain-containing protein 2-like isoform X1 [Anopheles merus]XP_041767357.1 GRIP and coiled-coil domain-containing protein 2-like isoform X1 [Anopheles merus]XP_041767358.1 GRIP and coiled-coil domain-containing protein 2-like isoform X1 [Anopheles merus]XP_041767359.1 GRIP and c